MSTRGPDGNSRHETNQSNTEKTPTNSGKEFIRGQEGYDKEGDDLLAEVDAVRRQRQGLVAPPPGIYVASFEPVVASMEERSKHVEAQQSRDAASSGGSLAGQSSTRS